MRQSIATISNPEFINLQPLDISPLISSCEIKVLYLNENRNMSYITKDVAAEMAKSLRGSPIVGWYKEEKEDFRDHGEAIVIEDGEFLVNCKTKPYGFVSPDAKVWFQDFLETDAFGNELTRTYLMTTGYLWTGQYPECQAVVDEGRPQSMELDEKTLQGSWTTDFNSQMEFFIINDAIFSKLCILGEDVEPCFEGASVTAPQVSSNFTKDGMFRKTLFTMMQELYSMLEGGKEEMEEMNVNTPAVDEEVPAAIEEEIPEVPAEEPVPAEGEETPAEEPAEEEVPAAEEAPIDTPAEGEPAPEVGPVPAEEPQNYELLEQELNELKTQYAALEAERNELLNFKNEIVDKQKDALIDKFSMLSDEDKKDVIDNKSTYSLDEIESKLSVICFRKQINFTAVEAEPAEETPAAEETPVVQFAYNTPSNNLPDWLAAVEQTKNRG